MRGTNGSSRYAIPFRVIPARGQVSEYNAKPPTKQSWHVLHEYESRSKLANDSEELLPQSGPLAFDSCTLGGVADVLAGESPADEINGLKVVATNFSDVSIS